MTNLQFPPTLYYLQDPFHHAPPPAGMHHYTSHQTNYPSHLLQQTANAFNFAARAFPFGAFHASEENHDVDERMEDDGRTNVTNLYPEILTIIFSKLDLQSKGRVARVRNL